MTKTTTAVLLTAALTTAASAGPVLTEADWLAAGDGLLTNDAISGLQWLDWSHTINRSYDDVSSQLGAGGEFEGFRYATYDEVVTLYLHAGAVFIEFDSNINHVENIPGATLLAGLLGETFTGGGEAIYDFPVGGPSRAVTAFNGDPYGHFIMQWFTTEESFFFDFVGHALVRVPAPGTAALLGFGGLIATRRRRN